MRRLLLIAVDYPPPLTIAGTIPSRLAAHLPQAGWEVVAVRSRRLARKRARPQGAASQAKPPRDPGRRDPFGQWLPFGEAVFDVPQIVREALRLHRSRPVDAVLSSAAPVAGCLAADVVARRIGRPVVHMHGDPWGPCNLRGPLRPFWTSWLEGSAERHLLRRAAALIVNTETTREAYLRAYGFLDPARVHALRSPCDPAALTGETAPPFAQPTALFPGSFSEWVPPAPILGLARALRDRADGGGGIRLALTDDPGTQIDGAGLPLDVIGRVPQAGLGSLMDRADALIAVSQPTDQRIPLKLSDFLCAERPVLVLEQKPNPELRNWLAESGMGVVIPADRPQEAASWLVSTLQAGRHPRAPRRSDFVEALRADTQARRLAKILDDAVEQIR
jgi:hypothetical protein